MKTSLRLASLLLLCAAPVAAQPSLEIQSLTVGELEKLVGPPTTVTLQMNAAPATILGEIGRQSGVKVDYFQAPQVTNVAPLSVNWKNEPFWSAVQTVGQEAGLRIYNEAPMFRARAWGAGRVFREGDEEREIRRAETVTDELIPFPFSFSAERGMRAGRLRQVANENANENANAKGVRPPFSVALNPYVTFKVQRVFSEGYTARFSDVFAPPDYQDVDNVTLRGNLLVDPGLSRFLLSLKMNVDSAVTDTGAALRTTMPYVEDGSLIRRCTMPLPRSEALGAKGPESQKIALLRGRFNMMLVSKSETWEITDIANARNKTKSIRMPDGVWTFTYGGVKTEGQQHTVNVSVECPATTDTTTGVITTSRPNSHRAPSAWQLAWTRTVKLEDEQGRKFLLSSGGARGEDTLFTAEMKFSNPAVFGAAPHVEAKLPVKLTIEIPTEFRQIEIPFEIRDIPLPTAPV